MAVPWLKKLISQYLSMILKCVSRWSMLSTSLKYLLVVGQRVAHVVFMHLCDLACSTINKLSCIMQYLELIHASARTPMVHTSSRLPSEVLCITLHTRQLAAVHGHISAPNR